jgi:hypothetical protein
MHMAIHETEKGAASMTRNLTARDLGLLALRAGVGGALAADGAQNRSWMRNLALAAAAPAAFAVIARRRRAVAAAATAQPDATSREATG